MAFETIEDAEAFALAAHKKAVEYLHRGQIIQAENNRLRAELRSPVVGTDIEALRKHNASLIEENNALLEEIFNLKTALRWVFLEEHIVTFAKRAIPNGSRKDSLMRNMKESHFVLKEDGKPWVIAARNFWRNVNYCVGMINPDSNRNRNTDA